MFFANWEDEKKLKISIFEKKKFKQLSLRIISCSKLYFYNKDFKTNFRIKASRYLFLVGKRVIHFMLFTFQVELSFMLKHKMKPHQLNA